MPLRPWEESPNSAAIIDKVQEILRSKKLSLYAVSQRSAAWYGRSSPHFVPHNLYYDLRSERFSPSVHQIFSLSQISSYRLRDWLRVFGLDLENITRLQIESTARRTKVLDTSLTDPNEWIPWFSNRAARESPPSSITPLAQLLGLTAPRRISSISEFKRRFLYAKIGLEDALAFPDLVPGSIVRVDPEGGYPLPQTNSSASDRIFLVEHSRGYFCCRIRFLSGGVVVPVANGLDYAQVAFHLPQEARIRGVVDLELRPMLDAEEPRVPAALAHRWKPRPFLEPKGLGELLKTSRLQLDVSIREAAKASRRVAELMKDDRYFISASSLSDYELDKTSPRDFHKLITLSSVYGLNFEAMMKTMSLDLGQSGPELMPTNLFRAEPSAHRQEVAEGQRGFLEHLLKDCQSEVPFFLRDLLGYFSAFAPVTIDDFFWIGGDQDVLHPTLVNGLIVLLNRRRKAPIHLLSKPVWQQPIFVVFKRDGNYLAASCSLENGRLVVHSYGPEFRPGVEYRLHRDAEIVGQIVAIARRVA